MDARSPIISGRAARVAAALLLAFLASVLMTWPLAARLGSAGRVDSGDGRFSIWNVAWVAHAVTAAPSKLYDANIFYPHRETLAFSEANLGAGILATPVWLATHNPYAAHNSVVLFAFAASLLATWLLVRHLTADGDAAAVAAAMFAFCPFLFTHTAHIQLLMCAGIPLSMLAMHRLVEQPSAGRAAALGCALAAQGLCCAYYGIFAGLMVGYATLFYAVSRGLWRAPRYWLAVGGAAAISIGLILPFFLPYLQMQETGGFRRSLDDARMYSAIFRSYLASSAKLHRWILPLIGTWNNEALFPGIVAVTLGTAGLVMGLRRGPRGIEGSRSADAARRSEATLLYGSLGVLAFWASLGPAAGLYSALFRVLPVFSLLRAPGRMGLIVAFSLAVLSGFAIERLRARASWRGRAATVALVATTLIDLNQAPLPWRQAEATPAGYELLAQMPKGPVAEFPFFDRRVDFHLHTRYMLFSTFHWQPLVNGYSDYIPLDFRTLAARLGSFPSRDAFAALQSRRTRYIVVHRDRDGYGRATADIDRRLEPFRTHLRPIAQDDLMTIFEVVSWPE